MTSQKYIHARNASRFLNRLLRHNARPRKGEHEKHFKSDRLTARSIITDPNILGFGVGPKISGKPSNADYCLIVFVRRKLASARLRGLFAVPKYLTFNTSGLKVLTDVQVWGKPPVAHALSAGASIGDMIGNAGTLTLVVADSSSNEPLLLSCSHVLARCGLGHRCDEIECPGGMLASSRSIVGNLWSFTKIDPASLYNEVDAAVAKPLEGEILSNDIPEIGVPTGIRDLRLEEDKPVNEKLQVKRTGIASGFQEGEITNLHISTRITYHQLPGDPGVWFTELVQYNAPSEEGDSGAAVVDDSEQRLIVGMHIAGLPDLSGSFFTHIVSVFDTLGLKMLATI